jgi:hypothetical protein
VLLEYLVTGEFVVKPKGFGEALSPFVPELLQIAGVLRRIVQHNRKAHTEAYGALIEDVLSSSAVRQQPEPTTAELSENEKKLERSLGVVADKVRQLQLSLLGVPDAKR